MLHSACLGTDDAPHLQPDRAHQILPSVHRLRPDKAPDKYPLSQPRAGPGRLGGGVAAAAAVVMAAVGVYSQSQDLSAVRPDGVLAPTSALNRRHTVRGHGWFPCLGHRWRSRFEVTGGHGWRLSVAWLRRRLRQPRQLPRLGWFCLATTADRPMPSRRSILAVLAREGGLHDLFSCSTAVTPSEQDTVHLLLLATQPPPQ